MNLNGASQVKLNSSPAAKYIELKLFKESFRTKISIELLIIGCYYLSPSARGGGPGVNRMEHSIVQGSYSAHPLNSIQM
jgi:hypothetical protein